MPRNKEDARYISVSDRTYRRLHEQALREGISIPQLVERDVARQLNLEPPQRKSKGWGNRQGWRTT